jgi:hypothetical protein
MLGIKDPVVALNFDLAMTARMNEAMEEAAEAMERGWNRF